MSKSDPHPGKRRSRRAIRAGDETNFSRISTSSFRKIIKINSKSITYFEADANCNIRIWINGRWDSISGRLELTEGHDPKTLVCRSIGMIRSLWWFMWRLIETKFFFVDWHLTPSVVVSCLPLNGSCLLPCILCICSCPWINTNVLAIATAVDEVYSFAGAVPAKPEWLRSLSENQGLYWGSRGYCYRGRTGSCWEWTEQPTECWLRPAPIKPELFPLMCLCPVSCASNRGQLRRGHPPP